MERSQKKSVLTDVENNQMDTKERRGGGRNREIGIYIYIYIYIYIHTHPHTAMYKIDN